MKGKSVFTNPTIAEFKDYFDRDFPFNEDMNLGIRDKDITRGIVDATYSINPDLFTLQQDYSTAFLLLTAHFIVSNIRTSSGGLSGSFNWLTTSKGVGSVSESYQIPEQVSNNAYLAMLAKTSYGARYLEMILPKLIGNIMIVGGGTQA